MNFQDIFNFVVAALTGLLTWIGKALWDDVQINKSALATLREEIATQRVHKDDLHSMRDEILAKLTRIEDKIDRKVDK